MMVCFLAPAGCFVFMGTLGFCFCGYDLLTGLARTPKVTWWRVSVGDSGLGQPPAVGGKTLSTAKW